MCPLCRAVSSIKWNRIHRSVTGSVRQGSVPRDGASRSRGAHEVPVPGAGLPVVGQQLGDRDLRGDAHLPVRVIIGPRALAWSAEHRELDPRELDPAQVADQPGDGRQRRAGERRPPGAFVIESCAHARRPRQQLHLKSLAFP